MKYSIVILLLLTSCIYPMQRDSIDEELSLYISQEPIDKENEKTLAELVRVSYNVIQREKGCRDLRDPELMESTKDYGIARK